MSKTTLMKEPYVEIVIDKSTNVLTAKWFGFLKSDDVKKGCSLMTKYVKENHTKSHLSDHSQLRILSKEVQDYLTQTWFPEMEKVGLKKIGAVLSEDVFAAATVNKVNKEAKVGRLSITSFGSEKACTDWLLN